MSYMVLAADLFYVMTTIILKSGKIIPNTTSLVVFGLALSYIISYYIVF